MTQILAFSGRKQSGKTTSGEFIQNLISSGSIGSPITYGLYSFADPLKKNICMDLLGLTEQQCYGSDDDKNSLTSIRWRDMPDYHGSSNDTNIFMTARQVMEFVGTHIFRKIKQDIWVDATIRQIKKDNYDLAIILDTRFPDEVDAILNVGGYVVRLCRDQFNSLAEPEVALDQHRYDWSKFSLIVDNQNMTLEEKNNMLKQFVIDLQIIEKLI